MAYKFDAAKELLKKKALSQPPYDGPTEKCRFDSLTFDEATRKAEIHYTIIKGKKTIDKRFTYLGIQYKIYSDWKYTETSKVKKITLTNAALEQLNSSTEEVIKSNCIEICKNLPYCLQPSWFKKKQIEEKYQTMEKAQISKAKQEFDPKNTSALNTINKNADNIKTLTTTKQTNEEKIHENEKMIQQLTEYNTAKQDSFFKFLFKKKIEKNETEIYDLNIEIQSLKDSILVNEKEIEICTNEQRKAQDHYTKINQDYNAKIAEIKNKLLENKTKELNAIVPLTEKIDAPKSGGATEAFIKEERNKMNRIYKDNLTLKDFILKRDNYTCQQCGNSTEKEPNLLLEVDHIHPVSKWGPSVPDNLQTLCWKCNRSKSNK